MSLELRDIHKHFGPVRANDGVSLTIEAGTLHGLLGENGAGKSTLMKVLSGFIERRLGRGASSTGPGCDLASPRDAIRAGIGMLHQDPLVFLPFSVLDNFLLGSPGRARVDRGAGARALRETCDRFGFSFDPDAPARTPHGRRAPAARDRPAALARRPGADPRRADHRDLGDAAHQLFDVLRDARRTRA